MPTSLFTGLNEFPALISTPVAVAIALPLILTLANYLRERARRRGLAKIPGPASLPLIGNALQIPAVRPYHVFGRWKEVYGDIIQLDLLGYHLVAVNSSKIALDLLGKRSAIYSDRPHFTFAGDICRFDKTLTLMNYKDEGWKKQRKFIAQEFSTASSISRYWPLQEQQARSLVSSLLQNPRESIRDQIAFRLGMVIMRIVYGYSVEKADDEFLGLALKSLTNFSKAGQLGNYLVDFFPLLKHVPEWAGAGFKVEARSMREVFEDTARLPFEWSKINMVTGKALAPNLVGSVISDAGGSLSSEQEQVLQWAGITSVGAGLDTSTAAALTFFLVMIMYPEIQKKGQAEIDAVIGNDRLPGIADKPSLPYVRSVMTEVLRWNPPIPFGIPHAIHQDDYYEGYHIPKDAIILPNIWYMMRDPDVFTDPAEFNPDRYNNDEDMMKYVNDHVFGFGRRACPGLHFAQGALFSLIATTFATCNVTPELDGAGKPILPDLVFSDGVFSFPPDFKYKMLPRSSKASALLADAPGDSAE